MKFVILNFDDSIVSYHRTSAATLRAWYSPGSRYGWSIHEVNDDKTLGKRMYAQELVWRLG